MGPMMEALQASSERLSALTTPVASLLGSLTSIAFSISDECL